MQPRVGKCRRKVLALQHGTLTPLPSCQGPPSCSAPFLTPTSLSGVRPDSCLAASSPLFLGLWAWPRLAH